MHFFQKYKSNIFTIWLLTILMLLCVLTIPSAPFSNYIFIPIVFCKIIPRFRFGIVFLMTLVLGMFGSKNFFSMHVYNLNTNDPIVVLFGKASQMLPFIDHQIYYSILGVIVYLVIFFAICLTVKIIFRKFHFYTSTGLVFIIMSIIWASQWALSSKTALSYVFGLSAIMLAHHAFYIFNFIKFFNVVPKTKERVFALFQPFWFLTFEIPENPIMQIGKSKNDELENVRKAFYLIGSSLIFKCLLVVCMSLFYFFRFKQFVLVADESKMFFNVYIPIFSNWRSENVFLLITTIFFSSLSYLVSGFFVYGTILVGVARLCGFMLPNYIDRPWRSSSFADFFSRTMYYYNIIIINLFFYPALDFSRKFILSKKMRIFLCLNWALIFGGFFARFMKDIYQVYLLGFQGSLLKTGTTSLAYLIVLAFSVSISLYFYKKKPELENGNKIGKMLFYIFIYGLINPLNYSRVFGGIEQMLHFYLKVFSLGLIAF